MFAGRVSLWNPRGRHMIRLAIGVIYRPETERPSHDFHARPADQFDAVIHLDRTDAVRPLEDDPGREQPGELPDIYPAGV